MHLKKNKAEGEDKGELWLSAGKEDEKESYVCRNNFIDLRSNVKSPDTKSQPILTASPPARPAPLSLSEVLIIDSTRTRATPGLQDT